MDDDFIVDEMDPGFHPSAGYRTPRRAAVRRDDERRRRRRRAAGGHDEAGADASAGDSGDGFGGDGEHDSPKGSPNGDETDIAPLPLDDDLEDENGVRGTVVGFKTPPVSANDKARGAKIAEGKENAPHTGSTVVLEWGKTAQKAARPEPAKRARSRAKQTTMKLKFDAATILDRDAVSRAIRDASDIVKTRAPGAVRKMADLADDDRPFGADEERDDCGNATLGYYRDAHGSAPPPEAPADARAAIRGAAGGRDPILGHRASRRWLEARAGCVRALWARAGRRRGAGFARDARARLRARGVAGDAEDVARVVDFDARIRRRRRPAAGFTRRRLRTRAAGDAAADAFTPGAGRLSAARARRARRSGPSPRRRRARPPGTSTGRQRRSACSPTSRPSSPAVRRFRFRT